MKIGLLIDNKELDKSNSDLCNWIYKNKNLSIELLIINKNKKFENKSLSLFKIINKIIFILLTSLEKFFYYFDKKYQFDDFDLAYSDHAEITINLKYDYAILQF